MQSYEQWTEGLAQCVRLLIVSMISINSINTVGVPWGTKCSNMWLVLSIHLNNMNLIHRGRAKVSVSVKSLVLVKMYSNNPRMNEFRLFSFLFLRIVFIFLV